MQILLTIILLLSDTNPLESYRWKNRVLLVFSESTDLLSEQKKIFQVEKEGLIDRDLKIFIIGDEQEHSRHSFSNKEIETLQRLYNKPKEPYKVVLIGKDGGVKRTILNRVMLIEELYGTIDSMPMRKSEMKNNELHQ